METINKDVEKSSTTTRKIDDFADRLLRHQEKQETEKEEDYGSIQDGSPTIESG